MAVTSCRRISDDASYGLENKNSYTHRYRIHTDTSNEASALVYLGSLTATPDPIPKLYSAYAYDPNAYVLSISLTREGDSGALRTWVATVTLGELPKGKDPQDGDAETINDPLKRPTRWSGDFDRITKTYVRDRHGKAIVNSAGKPFDEPILGVRSLPVMVARKNYSKLKDIFDISEEYDQTVNSKKFEDRVKRTVKFDSVTPGDQQFERGIRYYVATFRFVYRPETWDDRYLNQGYHYLDAPDGNLVVAADSEGQQASEPVLLAADGTKLPQGDEGTFTDPVELYSEKDFGGLDL